MAAQLKLVKQIEPFKEYSGLAQQEVRDIIKQHLEKYPHTKVKQNFCYYNRLFNLTLYK